MIMLQCIYIICITSRYDIYKQVTDEEDNEIDSDSEQNEEEGVINYNSKIIILYGVEHEITLGYLTFWI